MFIAERDRKLLPRWAKFVRGVISSSMLQPTASREDIHKDENMELVQMAIEEQLLLQLEDLSQNKRRIWNQIVKSHADLIMGWASSNDQFFDRIADQIELNTSRGSLTIGEYLKESGSDKIFYQTRRSPSLCEQVLLEGRDTPVIDASFFGVHSFLSRYIQDHPHLQMVPTDQDLSELMSEVRHGSFDSLLDAFRTLEVEVKIAEFQPDAVPAVVLFSEYAEFIEDSAEALEKDELMPGIAELISGYVDRLHEAGEKSDGVLMLNAQSALIQKMAQAANDGDLPSGLCQQILHSARIFSGRMLDARTCIESFESYSNAILEQIS
jgi:molecular chaperone HtpG